MKMQITKSVPVKYTMCVCVCVCVTCDKFPTLMLSKAPKKSDWLQGISILFLDVFRRKPEPVDVTIVIGLLDDKSCSSCRRLLTCYIENDI